MLLLFNRLTVTRRDDITKEIINEKLHILVQIQTKKNTVESWIEKLKVNKQESWDKLKGGLIYKHTMFFLRRSAHLQFIPFSRGEHYGGWKSEQTSELMRRFDNK